MNSIEPSFGSFLDFESKLAMMEKALVSAGVSLVFQNAALAIVYSQNLPEYLPSTLAEGADDISLFGEKDGSHILELKRGVLETGKAADAEVSIPTVDGMKICEIKIERSSASGAFGIVSVITEVTESRHREKVLKSLLRELSHRSKNLLAIIQGIATQTARNTLSLDKFLIKFRGRLQSLSNSQDLITDSSWRGAYLFELAEKQFAPYWPENAGAVPVHGINAHLSPNAAVHLGLALHELIVNSASHGAIAFGASSITLDCRPGEIAGRGAVEIVWSETILSPTDNHEFEDNSFSKTVLERVVPTSMNGRASLLVDGHHLEYRLLVPETEYEALKQA